MRAKYLEWDNFSILAIAGRSGSGKTSTARFLIAQLVMMDVEVFILDPHGNMKDSLTNSIPYPTYIHKNERLNVIRTIYADFLERIQGKQGPKIAVFIDETTAHFLECTEQEVREQATFFLRLANEGRRSNIRFFLMGHNWKKDFVGARSVRSSFTHVLFHAISDDEIKLLAPSLPTRDRRMITSFQKGEAYLFPDMVKLRIPYITSDDMEQKEHKRAYEVHHKEAMHAQNTIRAKDIDKRIAQISDRIIECKRQGMSKEETIKQIFSTYKSSNNKKWRAASKLYDKVMERM